MKIKSMLVFLGLFLVAANANIIDNPTFANGLASWDLANYSGAYATFSGQSSGGLFTIATPGTERWHVQLSQRALKIVKGKTYQLFFQASSIGLSRTIDVRVGRSCAPYDAYGEFGSINIPTQGTTITQRFTMGSETDLDARLEFNLGLYSTGILINAVDLSCLDCASVPTSNLPSLNSGNTYISVAKNMILSDRVQISGGNVFASYFEMGADTKIIGNVAVGQSCSLRERASISGLLVSPHECSMQNGVTITEQERNSFVPTNTYPDVVVGTGVGLPIGLDQVVTIDPGSYGLLTVDSRSRITLNSGVYSFSGISSQTDINWILDLRNGPIIINIGSGLRLGDRNFIAVINGNSTEVEWRVGGGDVDIGVQSIIKGLLIAQNSSVHLASRSEAVGGIYAQNLLVDPDAIILGDPLSSVFQKFEQLPDGTSRIRFWMDGVRSANIVLYLNGVLQPVQSMISWGSDLITSFASNALSPGDRLRYQFQYSGTTSAWYQTVVYGEHRTVSINGVEKIIFPYNFSDPIYLGDNDSHQYALAIFKAPLTAAEEGQIELAGAKVLTVVSSRKHSLVLKISYADDLNALANALQQRLPDLFFNVAALPKNKVVTRSTDPTTTSNEPLRIIARCQDDVDLVQCKALVQQFAEKIEDDFGGGFRIRIREQNLAALAAVDEIASIAEDHKQYPSENYARQILNVDLLQSRLLPSVSFSCAPNAPPDHTWLAGQPYSGDGIDVGVYDYPIDSRNVDFQEGGELRSFIGNWDFSYQVGLYGDNSHGTNVAGIIGGNGENSQTCIMRGVAPKVHFGSFDMKIDYENEKGHVTNHSHESSMDDFYYTESMHDMDRVLFKQNFKDGKRKVIVMAAGNSGGVVAANRQKNLGYYSESYAMKNNISVGAVSDVIASPIRRAMFSAMGPTPDGRIKPDIMAPGGNIEFYPEDADAVINGTKKPNELNYIYSAVPQENGQWPYAGMAGTSQAAPQITGIVALMLQKYRNDILGCPPTSGCLAFDQQAPRNSTIKAMLINTATDVVGKSGANWDQYVMSDGEQNEQKRRELSATWSLVGPDFSTGWGAADASKAVDIMDSKHFHEIDLRQGEEQKYSFTVPSNAQEPINFTIAWDDRPSGCTDITDECQFQSQLINDIDIYLKSPSGRLFYPWKLRPFFGPNSFHQQTYRVSPFDPITHDAVVGNAAYRDCRDIENTIQSDLSYDCFDHLNPEEKITVDVADLESGVWTAVLIGRSIATVSNGSESYQTVSVVSGYPFDDDHVLRGLYFASGSSEEIPCPQKFTRISTDLNKGADGAYMYLCASFDPSIGAPITSVDVAIFSKNENTKLPSGFVHVPSDLYKDGSKAIDLNRSSGGEYVFMYLSRDASFGEPIRDITITHGTSRNITPAPNWVQIQQDLNKGAGGDFLYVQYRKQEVQPITDLFLKTGGINEPCELGYETVSMDLNQGSGGTYIHLCAARIKEHQPIYDIQVRSYSIPTDFPGLSGYHNVASSASPDGSVAQDLNSGSGGKYIYMYYNTFAFGQPIMDISFVSSSSKQTTGADPRWTFSSQDLNEGTGGDYIYLTFERRNLQ